MRLEMSWRTSEVTKSSQNDTADVPPCCFVALLPCCLAALLPCAPNGTRDTPAPHSNRKLLMLNTMQEIAPSKVREQLSTNIYRSSISDLNVPEWVDVTPVPLEQETRGGRRAAEDIKGNGYRGARGKGCSGRTAGVCLSAGCSVAPRELAGRTPFPDRDRRSPP